MAVAPQDVLAYFCPPHEDLYDRCILPYVLPTPNFHSYSDINCSHHDLGLLVQDRERADDNFAAVNHPQNNHQPQPKGIILLNLEKVGGKEHPIWARRHLHLHVIHDFSLRPHLFHLEVFFWSGVLCRHGRGLFCHLRLQDPDCDLLSIISNRQEIEKASPNRRHVKKGIGTDRREIEKGIGTKKRGKYVRSIDIRPGRYRDRVG